MYLDRSAAVFLCVWLILCSVLWIQIQVKQLHTWDTGISFDKATHYWLRDKHLDHDDCNALEWTSDRVTEHKKLIWTNIDPTWGLSFVVFCKRIVIVSWWTVRNWTPSTCKFADLKVCLVHHPRYFYVLLMASLASNKLYRLLGIRWSIKFSRKLSKLVLDKKAHTVVILFLCSGGTHCLDLKFWSGA